MSDTINQARAAWSAVPNAPADFEAACSALPPRHSSAGWAARWAASAADAVRQLAKAREAKERLDSFIALSHDHVPQGLIDQLQASVDEHDAGLPEGDHRCYGTPERLCRFDSAAAFAAAHAANGLGLLRVETAKAALMTNYAGPADGVNPLMAQWRKLHRCQEAMRHAEPPEGSIREHAARWIADPTEENRVRLALFVA